MIYQLHNSQETANAIYQIQQDATAGQLKVSDFQWFITTIQEAIDKKLIVNLDVRKGIIKSAVLEYESGKPNPSMLTIEFDDKTINQTTSLSYTFNAELVEENTNSVPGNFMKYYINDDNHQVIVKIVVNYK